MVTFRHRTYVDDIPFDDVFLCGRLWWTVRGHEWSWKRSFLFLWVGRFSLLIHLHTPNLLVPSPSIVTHFRCICLSDTYLVHIEGTKLFRWRCLWNGSSRADEWYSSTHLVRLRLEYQIRLVACAPFRWEEHDSQVFWECSRAGPIQSGEPL